MSTTSTPGAVPGVLIKQPDTAISLIDEAVNSITIALQLNAQMQRAHQPGTTEWHHHESIDDKLHDALAALGQ